MIETDTITYYQVIINTFRLTPKKPIAWVETKYWKGVQWGYIAKLEPFVFREKKEAQKFCDEFIKLYNQLNK